MLSLYIHIPFCRQKCNYCDFVSYCGQNNLQESYLSALPLEMSKYSDISIETLYIGGGTPTVLKIEQIKSLIECVRNNFNCHYLAEATMEANPESLTNEKLMITRSCGINRLSIGVQSFSDSELKALGRIHSVSDFEKAFKSARVYGFSNINIDLIYGLPEQALTDWKKNLEKCVAFNPEHISLYPLTIEPGTKFFNDRIAVGEDVQADMYEWSMDYLSRKGYEHYEISNWARPGYKCRHNLTYWQNKEYIGLGVSAASYFEGRRFKNLSSLQKYIEKVNLRENYIEEEETIDESKKFSEDMILKLRCNSGIQVSDAINEKFGPAIEQMLKQQLLEKAGKSVKLTKQGKLLANQVLQKFV